MNFRLLPGQTSEIIIKGLKKLINHIGYEVREDPKAKPEDIFVYLEIPGEGAASIWRDYEASQTLKDFKAVIEKIYKIIPFYALAPGSTDAHYYRNDGYCKETINFGPGNAARAHTVDEYIEIEDFINAIKVYTLFAYNFLK